MLHNITKVAEQFGVSKRSVQLWCKAQGIKKIGNEYQITDEILLNWKSIKAKTETKDYTKQISVRRGAKASFPRSFLLTASIVLLGVFLAATLIAFYFNLTNEITERDTSIIQYKKEVQNVKNELLETTIKKDNEIQSLKKKIVIDSMLINTPYFNRRLKN